MVDFVTSDSAAERLAPVDCRFASRRLCAAHRSFASVTFVCAAERAALGGLVRCQSLTFVFCSDVTSYDKDFTFLTVKGSGHMVPQYRPVQAFAMFDRMINNVPWDCESSAAGCKPASKEEL